MSSLSYSYNFGYIPGFDTTELVTSVESSYVVVKVYPLFYNKIVIEWTIPASLGNCSFNIYKQDTESGPLLKINPTPLTGTNFIEDTLTQDFSKFHKSHYVVEVRLPAPDNRYIKSPPTTWENKRSNTMEIRAREITRRERILLSKFNGIDTLIFRRKYFGERCPRCYNTTIEKVVQDHCPTCLGTSFIGGYYPGILTKVCYEVSPNATQLDYVGKREINQTEAWTISYPEVMSLDLLLRIPDSKIFRIENMNPTELQTVQVRQLMRLTELGKNSVEMNLLEKVTPSSFVLPKISGTTSISKTGYVI